MKEDKFLVEALATVHWKLCREGAIKRGLILILMIRCSELGLHFVMKVLYVEKLIN